MNAASKPVQETWFSVANPGVVNYNTNWLTKYIEKKFNVRITWDLAPTSDVATKLSLLMSSGNYPAIIWDGTMSQSQVEQYGHEGILVPLNSLLKRYAPVVYKAMLTSPSDLKRGWTAPNGEIYGISSDNYNYPQLWQNKMWVNSSLLKKYRLSMPTTTAQLTHVLEVLKKHGITGIEGASNGWQSNPVPFLMDAFIYDNGTNLFTVNSKGQLAFAPVQTQWRQGLEYIHSLYANRLITSGAITQSVSLMDRADSAGKVFAFPSGDPQSGLANVNGYLGWTTMPALKGPGGIRYATISLPLPTSLQFFITNKATIAQKIAIMKILNWMWTPIGSNIAYSGPEYKMWVPAPKGTKNMVGGQAMFKGLPAANTEYTNDIYTWGSGGTGPMRGGNRRNTYYFEASPPNSLAGQYTTFLEINTLNKYAGLQPKEVASGMTWLPSADLQTYSVESTNIYNYVSQWEDEFIVGTKALTNANWRAYLNGLHKLDLSQFTQLSVKAMGKPVNTSPWQNKPKIYTFLKKLEK